MKSNENTVEIRVCNPSEYDTDEYDEQYIISDLKGRFTAEVSMVSPEKVLGRKMTKEEIQERLDEITKIKSDMFTKRCLKEIEDNSKDNDDN